MKGTFAILAPPPRDEPYPLVFAFHGDEGTNIGEMRGWKEVWDKRKDFVVIAPQNPWQMESNSVGWDNFPTDSENYLKAILKFASKKYDIDIDRVHITGVSAGSFWMGQVVFSLQNIFAAAQFSCGGYWPGENRFGYRPVDGNDNCKIAARIEINDQDFLYPNGQAMDEELGKRGHVVEFSNTACERPGHCCGSTQDYEFKAMEFFDKYTLCGQTKRKGCGTIGEVPQPLVFGDYSIEQLRSVEPMTPPEGTQSGRFMSE